MEERTCGSDAKGSRMYGIILNGECKRGSLIDDGPFDDVMKAYKALVTCGSYDVATLVMCKRVSRGSRKAWVATSPVARINFYNEDDWDDWSRRGDGEAEGYEHETG